MAKQVADKQMIANVQAQVDFCKLHDIMPGGMMPDVQFSEVLVDYFTRESAAVSVTYNARIRLGAAWHSGKVTFGRNVNRPMVERTDASYDAERV